MAVQHADKHVVVIGGGPAGLMAADVARAHGAAVDLFDRMPSVGRKILIAGKGGLNLSHSEPEARFLARYGPAERQVSRWLADFPLAALRDWAEGLGVATMVGSSGRVFPADLKAAPLLRGWVRSLRSRGVRFHTQVRWLGWDGQGRLRLADETGEGVVSAGATILALGGGSWSRLGSDGGWVDVLAASGISVQTLRPTNVGFETTWSPTFRERFAGHPIKPVAIAWRDRAGITHLRRGEFVIADYGVEGSLVYAASASLRDEIAARGRAEIQIDLDPVRSEQSLQAALRVPRGKRSFSEWLRRTSGLSGARAALLRECCIQAPSLPPPALAQAIKHLPLTLHATRPLEEAISSAGGLPFDALDDNLMLKARPGVFCAGEMLDWEAPTGGYLMHACLASGRCAARGALAWLDQTRALPHSGAPGVSIHSRADSSSLGPAHSLRSGVE